MQNPIFLIVQGTLHENSEEIYSNYARGVLPLMKEFGVETVAIGDGFESDFTNNNFPVNIVMKLPNEEALEKFLGDPRYLEVKEKYRDKAYKELQMSVFRGREPRTFD
ncbi:MAG: DUF1330 domain-containing protein [Pyrinomonadaceae bacterium]|jgi:uncharacterized protein (DUF1330 family)|nr:DUF1330 domain-containing protein [Pyrinomonadaceae bacterium]